MLNSTPFTNFSNSKSTITRKLSTNIQLEQRDLSPRSKKEEEPIFSIYKQNIEKLHKFLLATKKKKKKENSRGKSTRKSDRSYNKQCSKQQRRKKIYSKSFLICSKFHHPQINHINSSTAQCLSETKAKSNSFFFLPV